MNQSAEAPLVAVWMVTYNHERYIAKSLDGIIKQKTPFDYKIYIGEDCSTDSTREILKEYKSQYPQKIELLLNKENNIKVNARNTYEACFNSGARYIALCEGDDFWTNESKLKKQVEFLESNPEYSLSFHNLWIYHEKSEAYSEYYKDQEQFDQYLSDIKNRMFFLVPSCSMVIRNNIANDLPEWFYDLPLSDRVLVFLLAHKGRFKYFSDKMGIHNKHPSGMSVMQERAKRLNQHVFFYNRIYSLIDKKYVSLIDYQLLKTYGDLAISERVSGKFSQSMGHLLKCFSKIRSLNSAKVFLKDYLVGSFQNNSNKKFSPYKLS